MPREVITIQVGQCGNQIGCRFWDLVLREHAHVSKVPVFDASLSSFFRNVDSRYAEPAELPVGDGRGPIRTLKARAVLVDMEEKVVNSLLTGPLADLFDARQRITDVSGSGNNWAHGHHLYGPMYAESIEEKVRQAAESCDSLQCFFLLHSLGGGTGSGFGTYILQSLEDLYPDVFRFVSCVCPSRDDDVITSPYNSTLALTKLIDHAHCVLPVSNDALVSICNQISANDASRAAQAALTDLPQDEQQQQHPPRPAPAGGRSAGGGSGAGRGSAVTSPTPPASAGAGRPPRGRDPRCAAGSGGSSSQPPRRTARSAPPAKRHPLEPPGAGAGGGEAAAPAPPAAAAPPASHRGQGQVPRAQQVNLGVERPFDRMNSLVAHLLNNLTSSMRFEGSLNLDLNEITMNLVPFPRMHFLLSSMSPLYFGRDPRMLSRGFHQMFSDILAPGHQLMNVDPRGSTYMALAFLVRGATSISDVNRNVAKIKKNLKMLPYNEDAFKIGLCSVPPRGLPYSMLSLANSCAAHHIFSQSLRDFTRLYSKKAHVHHYTQYMEKAVFDEAYETVNSLVKDYIHLDMLHETPASCAAPPARAGGYPSAGQGAAAASMLFAPTARSAQAAAAAGMRGMPGAMPPGQGLQDFMPRPLI